MDEKGQVYFGAEGEVPPEDVARLEAEQALLEAELKSARVAALARERREGERVARSEGSRVARAEGKVPRGMEGK